jgi:hypothetical protein
MRMRMRMLTAAVLSFPASLAAAQAGAAGR